MPYTTEVNHHVLLIIFFWDSTLSNLSFFELFAFKKASITTWWAYWSQVKVVGASLNFYHATVPLSNRVSNSNPTPIYSKSLCPSVQGFGAFGAFGVIGVNTGVSSDLIGLGVEHAQVSLVEASKGVVPIPLRPKRLVPPCIPGQGSAIPREGSGKSCFRGGLLKGCALRVCTVPPRL